MAQQTALRRAQAQDEALMKYGDIHFLQSGAQKSPSPIHAIDRSLDCDSSASSQCSNPLAVVRKVTPAAAVPSTTSASVGILRE